jgi:GNAT superfamily N-acetyltransferase
MAAPVAIGREEAVVLNDGSTVVLRPLTDSDEEGLAEFLDALSLRSLSFRFFSAGVRPDRLAHAAIDVDGHDRFGLIATRDGRIVGHAMYVRSRPGTVEAAFAVADDLQCHGLGSKLVAHIAADAQANGFEQLEAEVLPENHRMLDVFAHCGLPLHLRAEPGLVHVNANLSGEETWNGHSSLDTTVQKRPKELSITRLPG